MQAPVAHVNYYEADAFANWSGARLPTEFEWERAALHYTVPLVKSTPDALQPKVAGGTSGQGLQQELQQKLQQCFADLWQWTRSGYAPYPGFTPFAGVAGEYNGKFMSNQYVLRGSSCATPPGHERLTYRNFFYPHQCWQFTGIRLAR